MLVGDFFVVVLLLLLFCLFFIFFRNLLSNDLPIGKILSGGSMSVRGQFLEKQKLCVLTKERKQQRYSATGYFLQYIYSVLVAKNHQKVRSRCLDHEFSFTYIFEWYYSWLQSSFIEEKFFVGASVLYDRTMHTAVVSYLLKA